MYRPKIEMLCFFILDRFKKLFSKFLNSKEQKISLKNIKFYNNIN